MNLDFSVCREVWVPDDEGGHWSQPPPHVLAGVALICAHPYFLLADDMGGMKTAQTIIAAQFLRAAGTIDRVIVVAPAEIRRTVWFDPDIGQMSEHLWNGTRHLVSEYHATIKSWKYGETGDELRWIVTNYEFIRNKSNLAVLLDYCGPRTLLVLDESTAVKGLASAQTAACMQLRWLSNRKGQVVMGATRCGRILLLSGTPLANDPLDMLSQGNLMHPSILQCKTKTSFLGRYATMAPVLNVCGEQLKSPNGWGLERAVGWKNLDDLQRRFSPYVLRREAKSLGIDFALPPVGLEFKLTEKTWRIYRQMRDEMVADLESGRIAVTQTAAVKSVRLSQITSGFVGGVEDMDFQKPSMDPTPDWMDDLLEPNENPGDVTVPTRGAVQEIGRERLDFALQWQAERLKQDPNLKLLSWCRFVPELRRYLHEVAAMFEEPVGAVCGEKIFDDPEWNKKREREFAMRLLHPKTAPSGPVTVGGTFGTGAMGLNFTACRTVLDISYGFEPWKKKQADARTNRPGQRGMVSYFYLIAVGPKGQKTIDHHVMMHRLEKANINDWTIAAWVRALTEE